MGVGTLDITPSERSYVLKVLRSNRLSYGPWSRRFEREFAKLHDSRFAVFVNSGTSALSIAIACLKEAGKWREGDEVIVPAVTFVATVNVVLEHHLRPVFVDVDPRTYNIDPGKIEHAITKRTRAIIPVHLFGLCADMSSIMRIARKHKLKVLEDSCETMGVRYRGRMTGSFGDISCFSTYVAHLVVTGVGGLALTKNERYAEILRSLANHGRDTIYLSVDDDKDIDGERFEEIIHRRFRFIRRGYSFRATEMEAALGVGQLECLAQILRTRRANAKVLLNGLKAYERFLQLPWYNPRIQEHAFMMFPIVIHKDAPFTKMELVSVLERWNIETRDMLPLINQPVYRSLRIAQNDYPVASWINTHGFYVGCHQGLKRRDLQYMLDVFQKFFRARSLI